LLLVSGYSVGVNADTAASMSSNVLCQRVNASFLRSFHSLSIRFRFGG
jgi:hypothetical protein